MLVTLWAVLCMNAAPNVCVQENVADSRLSTISWGECMGISGLESASRFAAENPAYVDWHFKGWRCQNGERINERKA
jgi:hypothetical protein